jgi:hypothetical protein
LEEIMSDNLNEIEIKTMQALFAVLMLVPDEVGFRCMLQLFKETYNDGPDHLKAAMRLVVNGEGDE